MVLEQKTEFWHVRAEFDGYIGWVSSRQLAKAGDSEQAPVMLVDDICATATSDQRTLHLPLGARLPGYSRKMFTLGGEKFRLEGNVHNPSAIPSIPALIKYAQRYLHTPYLWGGRTPWGLDCSGFTQVVFRAFGIQLARDSRQQILQGKPVESFAKARAGDLAFFTGSAHHVGLVCGPGQILHASAMVRQDRWDEVGIWNLTTGENTHQLTSIRRMI